MTTTQNGVLIRLISGKREHGICKGCKRPILWMETLSGKRMPMQSYAMPRAIGDGCDMYEAGDSHWNHCSDKAKFDRRPKTDRTLF